MYAYSNQRGCDGDRLYFDGNARIVVNGDVVARGGQFGVDEIVSLYRFYAKKIEAYKFKN